MKNDNCIYGIDTTKAVTPMMVRDAIINCFTLAHEEVLNDMKDYSEFKSEEEFQKMKQLSVTLLIKKTFNETGSDFENPTKESILKIIPKLQEFAANFRRPEIVKKHTGEIMKLVEKLS